MNISHKDLFHNNFSKEKRQFYEKIGNRYYHAYLKYKKKYSNNKDYKKKIINWLFSKDEETRMVLCSIENKKYTKFINDAYNLYKGCSCIKIYLKDDEDDSKVNLISINDPRLNPSEHNYYSKQRQFLNEIMFYQCESPINDYNTYSNYFTLSKIIKDQTAFINFCNDFSNNNFLQSPIEPKIKDQNKLSSTIYFKFPKWLYEDNLRNANINYDYDYDNNLELKLYYSLPKFIMALLEQVLSVRYILYNDSNNLQEILSSIYLSDLFDKRNKIVLYLTPKEIKYSYLYFKIDELAQNLYNDGELEKFILKNKIKEEGAFMTDVYFDKEDNIKDIILEGSQFFNKFLRDNTQKDFIDFFMLIHIQKIFTYDDFYFRGIFEKIYEKYSNEAINDLFLEKTNKKKRKKKKKSNNESDKNKDNYENNNNDKMNSKEIKGKTNNNKLNENSNKINIDFGEEILKILSESGISQNNKVENNIKEKHNLNFVISEKEDKSNYSSDLSDKRKIKFENKKTLNNENKENNKCIEENVIKEEDNNLIHKFIKDLLYEYLFKMIESKEEINNKKNKKKNKEKDFFLYDPTKNFKKKKKNNTIKVNDLQNKLNKDKDINDDNVNNNGNNLIIIDNSDKTKKNEKMNEEQSNPSLINKIKETNEKIKKSQNEPIISHINSFSFNPLKNKKKENNKIIINNNFININFQNNYCIVNPNITPIFVNKLNNSIQEYYNDLEEALSIQRIIKTEITNYLLSIIKTVFPDSNLLIYGSSLYNLDIDTSDLDISISSQLKISLLDLEKSLLEHNNYNQFSKINAILSASVPIIKFEIDYLKMNNEKINHLYNLLQETKYYKIYYGVKDEEERINYMNKINIDISLNSANDKQINFVKQILIDYPEIKPLIKIIKKILQIKEMNNSYKGGMSSYCLLLLVYSYIKFYYNKDKELTNNNDDCGTLLIYLLYYISCIDFESTIIAPHLINPFIMNCSLDSIPTIIEPISKQNAGKTIYKIFDVVNILYQIYKDIFVIMEEKHNDNLIYKLLKKYSPE